MLETPFSTAIENALYFRASDTAKNGKAFILSALVPKAASQESPGRVTAFLRIDAQGGFLITGLSGSARGPVNAQGVRLPAGATDFPAAGCSAGRADRGIQMNIADAVTGRTVTNLNRHFTSRPSALGAGDVLCPGYGFAPYLEPLRTEIFLPSGTLWQFQLENLDTCGGEEGSYHRLDLILSGDRYVR